MLVHETLQTDKPIWPSHRRILVVEDDPISRGLLSTVIHNIDPAIDVEYTATGEEAQNRLLKKSKFDLIIADNYLLGNITGLDLWNFCAGEYPNVPFLMTSGMKHKTFFKETKKLEDRPLFIAKPFSQREIHGIIEGLLEKNQKNFSNDDDKSTLIESYYFQPWRNILFLALLIFMPLYFASNKTSSSILDRNFIRLENKIDSEKQKEQTPAKSLKIQPIQLNDEAFPQADENLIDSDSLKRRSDAMNQINARADAILWNVDLE